MTRRVRILSYGGGLDSFAMLLRSIALGDLPDHVVFVDVADRLGIDPGEWPSTYRHIEDYVEPLCRRHGIPFTTIDTDHYPVRNARSLYAWLYERKQIPVGGPKRICTTIAKVERFERWVADHYPGRTAEVWIGFEAGEEARADKDPNAGKPGAQRKNRYPLIEWGWCRCRCESYVRTMGYPIPRKSACVFCPYASKRDFRTLREELPERFEEIVELERRKPPTKAGYKLSIKGFRKRRKVELPVLGDDYVAPTLDEWVDRPDRSRPKPCPVCGAAERATKATGCTYLEAPVSEAS
jgi:hypothetical protein